MYKIYNNHLLFHGCIPLETSGDFQPLQINQIRYAGKELLDFFEYHIRESSKNPEIQDDLYNGSYLVLLEWKTVSLVWQGQDDHPRALFIEDKETHVEKENPYFSYRNLC